MKPKFTVDTAEIERLERASRRVRQNATPSQRATMEMVDAAFEAEVEDMNTRHAAENKLRVWAEELTGFDMTISEIELMRTNLQKAKPGTIVRVYDQRGQGKEVSLCKTVFGTVDRVDRYINILERTVIDVTNNSQFTTLTFRGLIGLAFKRLLKRSQ